MTTVEDIRRAILTHDEISGELGGAEVRTRLSFHDGVPIYGVFVNWQLVLVYHSSVDRWYGTRFRMMAPTLSDHVLRWLNVHWLGPNELADLYIRPLDSLPEIRRLVEVSP
jgi:hypothetical protein